jgi:hypothetical protein
MSRLQALVAQPRLALGALLTLLLAAGAVVGSGADFTASSANPSNTFAAGTLSVLNSKSGIAVLTASNMKPGAAPSLGTVDIQNTGSLAGAFTLSRGTLTDSDSINPLSAKLNVIVTDCHAACGDGDDSNIYTGTLAAMGQDIALGSYAPTATHRYQVSVALDGSAGNAYQGDTSTVQLDFNAS